MNEPRCPAILIDIEDTELARCLEPLGHAGPHVGDGVDEWFSWYPWFPLVASRPTTRS